MNKIIVAHRGAPKLARENTLESFQKAIELGADVVELDVWKTADGQLAVFHDDELDGAVVKLTPLNKLNALAAGHNYLIPTLAQVLELIRGKIRASIELKDTGYEQECLEAIKQYLSYNEYEIISFKFPALGAIRLLDKQARLALILGWSPKRSSRYGQMLYFLVNKRKIFRTVNAFCLNWRLVTSGFYRLIPPTFPITVWTVDEAGQIKKFLSHPRVTSLTSNDCELALGIKRATSNSQNL